VAAGIPASSAHDGNFDSQVVVSVLVLQAVATIQEIPSLDSSSEDALMSRES